MAIIPEAQYPGKIAPATTEYPYGAARNITLPGDGTGTPWEAALVNDLFGFQQAILSRASIVPTGTPEKANDSQYLRAIERIFPPTLADMEALSEINTANLEKGQQYLRREFWSDTQAGQATIEWDPDEPVANHTGGKVIDPAKLPELDFLNKTAPASYYEADTVSGNTGCFIVRSRVISPDLYGVIPGVANEQGMRAVFKYHSEAVHLYDKAYVYSGSTPITGFVSNNFRVSGAGEAEITVQADTYLFEHSTQTNQVIMIGFIVRGGRGAYRSTFTGTNNTGGSRTYIERCTFLDYTRCAYSHESADRPYQTIFNNKFRGVSGGSTIGVSITGLTDGLNIERNDFLSNEYHIRVLSKSSSANISANNFFSQGGIVKKADIWVVPVEDTFRTVSGPCLNINKNKFGSENQPVGEPKILIANSSGLATDVDRPDLTSSANTVYGLIVNENRIAGPQNWAGSFVLCYIEELIASNIDDNVVQSGLETMRYVLEYNTVPKNFSQSRNTIRGTKTGNGSFFSMPITNGIDRYDSDLFNWGAGFAPEVKSETNYKAVYENYSTATVGAGNATVTAIANPDFGNNSGARIEYGLSTDQWLSGGGTFDPGGLIAANAGEYLVLEMDVAKSASNPLQEIEVKVRELTTPQDLFFQVMKIPGEYTRVQAVFKIPPIVEAAPTYRIIINPIDHSATSNAFELYNVNMYISNSPVNTKHLRSVGGTWDRPHLVLGGHHIWVDGTGALRINNGPPTSATDGVTVGSQT